MTESNIPRDYVHEAHVGLRSNHDFRRDFMAGTGIPLCLRYISPHALPSVWITYMLMTAVRVLSFVSFEGGPETLLICLAAQQETSLPRSLLGDGGDRECNFVGWRVQ